MKLKALTLAAPFVALAMIPAAADAATAFSDGRNNLYAGPSHRYPEVIELRDRSRVEVMGCTMDYKWCDVRAGRFRGWMDGDDLLVRRRGDMRELQDNGRRMGIPIIGFQFDDYWGSNYRRSAFWNDRSRWRDIDRDGIPNSRDRDIDGDRVPNRYDRDRDGDGINNRRDDRPNNPRVN